MRHMAEPSFVKVDLHIHTPASYCYEGPKDADEYLNIIRAAKSKDLRVISFTDHNSIEGYKKVLDIKDELANEIDKLGSVVPSQETKKRLKCLQKDLSIFDDILILPGIEFEVRNGIHLLIIFNSTTSIQKIETFLRDGGFSIDDFGKEETTKLSNWDIFALFEESRKYDCIVIDAHTDSQKGIYNTIPPSASRANCFQSRELNAVAYRSEKQRENLAQILTSREYKRETPLSFVRFSDSHSSSNVGADFTWFRLDQLNFESIKNALMHPDEMISTEEPSSAKILNRLMELDNCYSIPDLSENNRGPLKKMICALRNTNGGYVLLGVSNRHKVGMSITTVRGSPRNDPSFKVFLECLREIEPRCTPNITIYPLRADKVVISLYIKPSEILTGVKGDGHIYTLRNRELTTLDAQEIHSFMTERVTKQIESKIAKRITHVENTCLLVKNYFCSAPIMREFENNSRQYRFMIQTIQSVDFSPYDINRIRNLYRKNPNGSSIGNLIYQQDTQPPRLENAYLRYTPPIFILRNMKNKPLLKETIYIVPGGGVYYSNRLYPYYNPEYRIIPILHRTHINSPYGMKFTACFLKSSFLLWHCLLNHESVDLYQPEIIKSVRLPNIDFEEQSNRDRLAKLENTFDQIIVLEKAFLTSRVQRVKDIEKRSKIIDSHNIEVGRLAYQIDQIIYELLSLSNHDIEIIEEALKLNNIYLPGNDLSGSV